MTASTSAVEYRAGRFPALVVGKRASGTIALTETAYASGTVLPRHAHERACLVYVANGQFRERSGGELRSCGSGTVIFRDAGEVHAEEFGSPARCLNVEFGAEARPLRSFAVEDGPLPRLARSLYREYAHTDGIADTAIAALLTRLERHLGFAGKAGPPGAATAERIREFVDAHFLEALTAERLVTVFGKSAGVLQTVFRDRFGRTIGQHLRERRATFARDALERGDGSLADIALRAGFTDQSHMTNALRRRFGRTPGQLRRS